MTTSTYFKKFPVLFLMKCCSRKVREPSPIFPGFPKIRENSISREIFQPGNPGFKPYPRRTISDGELKVSVSDVQVIGHAQLKEELAVGIALANTMSSQDTIPGRPISMSPNLE